MSTDLADRPADSPLLVEDRDDDVQIRVQPMGSRPHMTMIVLMSAVP